MVPKVLGLSARRNQVFTLQGEGRETLTGQLVSGSVDVSLLVLELEALLVRSEHLDQSLRNVESTQSDVGADLVVIRPGKIFLGVGMTISVTEQLRRDSRRRPYLVVVVSNSVV